MPRIPSPPISPSQRARQAVRLRELARVQPRLWRALDRMIESMHTNLVVGPAKKGGA